MSRSLVLMLNVVSWDCSLSPKPYFWILWSSLMRSLHSRLIWFKVKTSWTKVEYLLLQIWYYWYIFTCVTFLILLYGWPWHFLLMTSYVILMCFDLQAKESPEGEPTTLEGRRPNTETPPESRTSFPWLSPTWVTLKRPQHGRSSVISTSTTQKWIQVTGTGSQPVGQVKLSFHWHYIVQM